MNIDLISANPAALEKIKLNSNQNKDLSLKFDELLNLKENDDSKREKKLERLKDASYELQSLLVNTMLKTMRSTVEKGDLFSGGFAEEIFESMLDEEYSKTISRTGNLGLAEIIYDQMKELI